MSFSRADRSVLATWWFTVDRVLLAAILVLMFTGLVLSLAASPAVALKKGLSTFHFFERHMLFSALGLAVMLVLSLMTPSQVRRVAAGLLLVALAGLVAVEITSPTINGAQRWLFIGGFSVQPSEIAKPAIIVILAWLFAEARERPDMPALPIAILIGAVFATLLVMQPDVGQTLLVGLVWGFLYVMAGLPLIGAGFLVVLGAAGLISAYFLFDHVRVRIDGFLSPSLEENSQLDRARDSFMQGGFFGRGPGEGTIKSHFPDAHTDFIFSVVAEEYGVIACLALVALFAFLVLRPMLASADEPRAADRLAVQGLAVAFGLQALINMGVNVGLLPAKGMTLPFISAGGSSILAVSITLGMLLAFTRRRADPARFKMPPRVMADAAGFLPGERR